jgi:hypothetical protein
LSGHGAASPSKQLTDEAPFDNPRRGTESSFRNEKPLSSFIAVVEPRLPQSFKKSKTKFSSPTNDMSIDLCGTSAHHERTGPVHASPDERMWDRKNLGLCPPDRPPQPTKTDSRRKTIPEILAINSRLDRQERGDADVPTVSTNKTVLG